MTHEPQRTQPELIQQAEAEALTSLDTVLRKPGEDKEARDAWERLRTEKYKTKERIIRAKFEEQTREILRSLADKMRRDQEVRRDTHGRLLDLEEYVRTVTTVGEAIKMRNVREKNPGAREAKREILETDEMDLYEEFMAQLEELMRNPESIEDALTMAMDVQDFLTLLQRQRRLTREPKPGESTGGIDLSLNEKNPNYGHTIDHLRAFITRTRDSAEKEISGGQKIVEAAIWMEIVRGMTWDQKYDLLLSFHSHNQDPEAEIFIMQCISEGVITEEDLLGFREHEKTAGMVKNIPDFERKVEQSKQEYQKQKRELRIVEKTVEKGVARNAALHYLNFRSLGGMFAVVAGVATVVGNVALGAAEGWALSPKGKRLAGAAKGAISAIGTPQVGVGVAELATGIHLTSPGYIMRNIIFGKSGAEKQREANENERKRFIEIVQQHPSVGDFLLAHYQEWLAKAQANQSQGKTVKIFLGDETFQSPLAPQDLALDASEIAQLEKLGLKHPKATMIRLFTTAFTSLETEAGKKLTHRDLLQKFFIENVYHHGPES